MQEEVIWCQKCQIFVDDVVHLQERGTHRLYVIPKSLTTAVRRQERRAIVKRITYNSGKLKAIQYILRAEWQAIFKLILSNESDI